MGLDLVEPLYAAPKPYSLVGYFNHMPTAWKIVDHRMPDIPNGGQLKIKRSIVIADGKTSGIVEYETVFASFETFDEAWDARERASVAYLENLIMLQEAERARIAADKLVTQLTEQRDRAIKAALEG